jgi:N-acetylmuramoyl-L-alanine amidase
MHAMKMAASIRLPTVAYLACVALAAFSQVANGALPVAIDVGHSKLKPGTVSARGKPEFEFNLELARILRETLAAQGVPSLLIGDNGEMDVLTRRTEAAARQGAGFFLSVHHDSAQLKYFDSWTWQGAERRYSDRFSGFSLFVSRKNPQPDVSLDCARKIGSVLMQAGLRASPHHGENLPGENREWADRTFGVYYFDDLVVLKSAVTPAVLIEAGVIVNREEELAVQEPAQRAMIAASIARGLSDCVVVR